jgi:hypothetical protein
MIPSIRKADGSRLDPVENGRGLSIIHFYNK